MGSSWSTDSRVESASAASRASLSRSAAAARPSVCWVYCSLMLSGMNAAGSVMVAPSDAEVGQTQGTEQGGEILLAVAGASGLGSDASLRRVSGLLAARGGGCGGRSGRGWCGGTLGHQLGPQAVD